MLRSKLSLAIKVFTVLATMAVGVFSTPSFALADAPSQQAMAGFTCQYYFVRWGDNLTRIAVWYGVTVRSIMDANGLVKTTIYPNQRLCIPRYTPTPSAGGWQAQYWNNTTQSGTPALVRSDASLDFNWGYGSPDRSRVFANYFSARWTRAFTFVGGVYHFSLIVDDGIRLFVDGNVILDRYSYVGAQNNQLDVPISPGIHAITVDYVQQAGLAYVRAAFVRVTSGGPQPCGNWCPPVSTNGPWYAQYYSGIDLNGALLKVASYGGLNFNWGWGSPDPAVPTSLWSVRYMQTRYFAKGVYRFVARSDDGVRIFVDDKPVVNQWVQQSARTITGDIALNAGNHNVRVEYMQVYGVAELQVYWEFLGNPNP
jgi:hypothetical protein